MLFRSTRLVDEAVDGMPPQQAADKRRQMYIDYNYVDESETRLINAAFRSKDPQKVSAAVQSLSDYLSKKPTLDEFFDKDAVVVANLHLSGYTPMQAVEEHQAIMNMPQQRKQQLELEVDDDKFVTASVKDIRENFDELQDTSYGKNVQADSVFENVFKHNYVFYNGNKKAAESATQQFMARNWGVTAIGKEKTLMFQAPSTFIRQKTSKEFEPKQIKDIFIEEATANLNMSVSQAEEATIIRVPSNDAKGNPQYKVFYYGQPVQTKSGRDAIWTFDIPNAMTRLFNDQKMELESNAASAKERVRLLLEGKSSYDENAPENVGDNM